MSEKEYEISYNEYTDTYTVTEKKPYSSSYEPSLSDTPREKLGKTVRNWSPQKKLKLTKFINIYGDLYRLGSNSLASVLVGLWDLFVKFGPIVSFMITGVIPFIFSTLSTLITSTYTGNTAQYFSFIPSIIIALAPSIIMLPLSIVLWIIDIISMKKHGEITFLGMKEYKPKFK